MSWRSIGWFLSGLKGAYNDINPTTLTGAIDIIVVKQPDGSFKCSPIYVRFGKLTALSPADKIVEVYVNGDYVEFLKMRLNNSGDAYFVNNCVSFEENQIKSNIDVHKKLFHDDSWSTMPSRRKRHKIRRDSVVSEPDSDIHLEHIEMEMSSDCESECHITVSNEMRNIRCECVSDGELETCPNTAWNDHHQPVIAKESVIPCCESECNTKLEVENKYFQGLYLEDLIDKDEDTRETYIYSNKPSQSLSDSTSKPNSPSTEMCTIDHGYRSDNEHSPRSSSPYHPHVDSMRLSLCGGLSSEIPISEETFLENIVSYEDFINDPHAILSNPNLVICLNDRYYNWQVAAPLLISLVAFQAELPHSTIRGLEKPNLPKKQPRRTFWFSWGTNNSQSLVDPAPSFTNETVNTNEERNVDTQEDNSKKTETDTLENTESLQTLFDNAASQIPDLVGSLDSQTLLYFYSHYKQATIGKCNTPKPGFFDINGRKKWQAWSDLGDMSKADAQKRYVDKMKECNPYWDPMNGDKQRRVYVSRMVNLNPVENDADDIVSSDENPVFNLVKSNCLVDLTDYLNNSKSDEINVTDKNGMTPLHWACDRGYIDLANLLIERKASLDAQDMYGQSSLHFACSCGHEKLVRLLLNAGASNEILDNEGNKPSDLLEPEFNFLKEILLSS